MPSASPVPILWMAKSENGAKMTLLSAGSKFDFAVVNAGVWQFAHPTAANSRAPAAAARSQEPNTAVSQALVGIPEVVIFGGAESCMASAKLKTSALISEASDTLGV